MKKNKLCIIIGVLVFISILSFKAINKRWPIDYFVRLGKGDFETSFSVTKSADNEKGKYTVFVKDKYYVYDEKSAKIYDLETKKEIIALYTELHSISTNGEYIYCEVPGFLCQYKVDGTLVGKYPFNDSCIYIGTENVYSLDGNTCSILSAENIEKAGSGVWENRIIYDTSNVSINKKSIQYETKECFISLENDDSGESTIEEYENAIVISGTEIDLIEKDNSVCAGKDQFDSLCVYNGCLYAGGFDERNDYIYLIMSNGESEKVEDSPKYDSRKLLYSRGVQDREYLILLAENYFIRGIGSFENETNGSIGDYDKSNLCYIDMTKGKVICSYDFSNEIVLSMNIKKFTTIKDGIVYIYDAMTGQCLCENLVEGYEAQKSYQVEVCGDRIFFFCEGSLLDWIEI